MSITVLNGVFAFTESVPQINRAVTRSRHDLTVVDRESCGENIFGVTNESASGGSIVNTGVRVR
jgi:hypothetical protein